MLWRSTTLGLRSGAASAGVQRQYTGAAERLTNCQIGVFLSFVVPGRRLVLNDQELYFLWTPPPAWWLCARRGCTAPDAGG
ncbi:transposase [Actinomadura miaoliensis]|uniref:transposase n=1 Tax=Actinomadura miaoliensis TaxID=430685 RepID=UPI003CD099EB